MNKLPFRGLWTAIQNRVLYLLIFAALAAPTRALAEARPSVGLDVTAKASGKTSGLLRTPGITSLIGEVIGAIIGLVGVLFFVLMIYAGFLWMTARGSDEQVTKAKGIFSNAVIGMFIVVTAYYLTDFIFGALESGLTETPAETPTPAEE
jgi:hypothetical protein